jgi:hypothetical protein
VTFDEDEFGCLSLADCALALGVPSVQLARWCADGSIEREGFMGSPLSPDRLRIRSATIGELMQSKFNPPEDR